MCKCCYKIATKDAKRVQKYNYKSDKQKSTNTKICYKNTHEESRKYKEIKKT